MQSKEPLIQKKHRTILANIANVIAYIFVTVILVIFLVIIFVQTPTGQNFVRGKVQNYLSGKLKTKVVIGKLYINFPNSVILKNVYIEDQTKNTLL